MFRTIIINTGERVSLRDNWLLVETCTGSKTVPIDDIYSIVVDNPSVFITPSVVNAVTNNGGHIVLCDNKHMPSSEIFPISNYYMPLTVQRAQIRLEQIVKDTIWQRIVSKKIRNQAAVLSICSGDRDVIARLCQLSEEVRCFS